MDAQAALDPLRLRRTLGHYASGITIIAGVVGEEPVGFTCQSFHSVSIDPPLVSFGVMQSSTSWPRLRPTKRFSISVLAEGQHAISSVLARSGVDKWADIDWERSDEGNPVIKDALVWLDCGIYAEHAAGDHTIVVGRVHNFGSSDGGDGRSPLLFFKGQYRQLLV